MAGKWQVTGIRIQGGRSFLASETVQVARFCRITVFDEFNFVGRRMTFSLGTGNRDAAARSAANIYRDLLAFGVEATNAKYRAQGQREISSKVATIGEWIEAARGVSASNAATFAQYAASLRLIAGQILSVKKTKKRFGPGKGGAQAYRAGIDSASLEILSAQAVQRWRLAYVAQAKNPAQERSRMTSANSTIRQAKSLFADKIVRFLPDVRLPSPRPFSDVEFFPKQSARYFSRIDPQVLLRKAQSELAESDAPAFLAMLLALAAGLRRGEIDSLAWSQIDFKRDLIRIEATESASLKTADSRGEVPIDPERCPNSTGIPGKGHRAVRHRGGRRRIWAACVGASLPGRCSVHTAESLASQEWRHGAEAAARASEGAWLPDYGRARYLRGVAGAATLERGNNCRALYGFENEAHDCRGSMAQAGECRFHAGSRGARNTRCASYTEESKMNKWKVRGLSMRSEKKPDQLSPLKLAFKRPANFLRHADIQVTSMQYADHKERVVGGERRTPGTGECNAHQRSSGRTKEAICPPLRDAV